MALTTYSADDPHPGGSKNIVSSKASGPQSTGDYTEMNSSNVPDQSGSANDQAAKAVYGQNNGRMSRIEGEAGQALGKTPGSGDTDASVAFIDGGSLGTAKTLTPAMSEGFGPNETRFPQAAELPKDVVVPVDDTVRVSKAVTGQSNKSNNPGVSGSPGFPGLP